MPSDSNQHKLPDYLVVDMTRRVEDHLERIAAVDWNYFALMRFHPEAAQALSDFRRLDAHRRAVERA